MRSLDISEVAPGVFFAQGASVNWVALVEGADITLVDTGYPGNADDVEETLHVVTRRSTGRRLRAILITHAHSDHMGNVARLAANDDVAVLTSADEVPHVRREVLHQVGIPDIVRNPTPRVLRWAAHAVRLGGLAVEGFDAVRAHPIGVPLDIPGHPIAVATPGHTPGHSVYFLPDHGIVISGDSVITAHATAPTVGPQLLHPMFNHNTERMHRSLRIFATLDADRFLPGHGGVGHLPLTLPL